LQLPLRRPERGLSNFHHGLPASSADNEEITPDFLFMMDLKEFHEVIIVGAGPAGIAAAIRMSQLGMACLVLEKSEGPRVKQCGGAVSPYAVRIYSKLGFSEEYFQTHGYATNHGWIHASGIELHGQTTNGKRGFLVERRQLDWDFQQHATSQHSVRIEYGAEVLGIQINGGSVQAEARKNKHIESYSCRFLIAADGAASVIRTRLSGRKIRPRDMILTSSGVLESDAEYLPVIRFHEDHMPSYSWIFPYTKGRVNVGIGIYADVYGNARNRASVEALIGRMQPPDYQGKLSKWIINTNALENRVFGRRVFLAGDAGGFADAFTGEGISFALRSGIAAANTIARIKKFGAAGSVCYLFSMSPVIARLLISKGLQRFLTRFPAAVKFILKWCEKSGVLRRLVFRYFSNS
jgi:geranylgeranyl reductase family protein